MNNRLPVFSLRSTILLVLSGLARIAFAQDDLFITVSSPSGAAAETGGIFTTVSSPVAAQPAVAAPAVAQPVTKQAPLPAAQPATPVEQPAAPAASKKETDDRWAQELLRDPFWPVGFFPEGWKKKTVVQGDGDLDASGWKAAAGKIRISGTSRLGGKTVAIINGELKGIGEQFEILHAGKTYQWQIVEISADGRIQLKKQGIR